MQSIQVLTAQNVRIDYKIAGVGDRILAYIIDALIIFSYLFIVFITMGNLNIEGATYYILAYLPAFFYHLIFELLMNGQSIGKQVIKIRVVTLDGSRPSLFAYLTRWMLRIIDIPFYGVVAILTIMFSSKGQRVGDILAGTTVIKLTRTDNLTSNPMNEQFREDHQLVFPEVNRLDDNDIDLIDKALAFNRVQGESGPVELLAEKIKKKIGVKSDMPTIKFLYQVKKDFHHLSSQ